MPHYVAAEVEEIVVPCEAAVIEDFVVVGEAVAVSATMATRPVCGKIGHSALRCYKHFDVHYNGKESMPMLPRLGTMLIQSGTPTLVPLITSPPSLTS
jgi:hypothetical protein